MERQDINALLNTIRKKLGTEKGFKELGFTFYFDAMSACDMLLKILEKGRCYTSNPYLALWFNAYGFNVRKLQTDTKRYVIF